MQLSEKDFSEYSDIVRPMAHNCFEKLKKPSQYTPEELMGEAFITIMRLKKRLKKKGVEPGTDEFKYTMIKSVHNTFKMLIKKSYRDIREKRLPKVIIDHRNGHNIISEELTEKLHGRQLEYVKFLLSPPIEVIEIIKDQSQKECMRTIRRYLGNMTTQRERKLRQSIHLKLIGETE